MVTFISGDLMGSGELINLLAEADKSALDVRKESKTSRLLARQKEERMLNERISLLKEQNEALSDSAWYQFAIGMVSNVLNLASWAVSVLVPPVAPVVQVANQTAQGALNGVAQIDPNSKKARELGVDAEVAQKKANAEGLRATLAEEHMKEAEESARTVQNRLEKAIDNLQQSGDRIAGQG